MEQRTRAAVQKEVKLRSMYVWEYAFVFGKPVKTGKVIKAFQFDINGNLVPTEKMPESKEYIGSQNKAEAVVFDSITNTTSVWSIKFSGNRNLTKHPYRGDSPEYISQGNDQGQYSNPKDTSGNKWVVKFDGRGNKIEEIEYTSAGKIRTKLLHRYDATGKIVEDQEYTVTGAHIINYDENGNETQEIWYDLLDEPKSEWVYTYDYY